MISSYYVFPMILQLLDQIFILRSNNNKDSQLKPRVSVIFPFGDRPLSLPKSPFPLVLQVRVRLTKTGLGRLSFSQIFGRDTPKSCPGPGDVGDMDKLSR